MRCFIGNLRDIFQGGEVFIAICRGIFWSRVFFFFGSLARETSKLWGEEGFFRFWASGRRYFWAERKCLRGRFGEIFLERRVLSLGSKQAKGGGVMFCIYRELLSEGNIFLWLGRFEQP